jgi:hypothetical protein
MATYYCSPTGSDGNAGSLASPFWTLNKAWTVVSAGDIIYMRGGTYSYTSTQYLTGVNGSAGNLIKIWAYTGETPIITKDASFTYTASWHPLVSFVGDYVHWRGISITGNVQTDTDLKTGMMIADSSNNIFELLKVYHNSYGIWFRDESGNSDNNLVLNCDIYDNSDPYTPSEAYGDSDGLGFNVGAGNTNYVSGCRIYNNSDDGIDLYGYDGVIYIDKTWVFWNGLEYGTNDYIHHASGFKFGSTLSDHGDTVIYYVTNSIAYRNSWIGFNQNEARAAIQAYNNVTSLNGSDTSSGQGWQFRDANGIAHVLKNNISFNDYNNAISDNAILATNTFYGTGANNPAFTVTSGDFVSIDSSQLLNARQSNGDLPVITFLHLDSGSDLINAGTNVGLTEDCDGNAWDSIPSLGAFEYNAAPLGNFASVTTTAITNLTKTTASSGGNVTDEGGSAVTARGVCWSETINPSTADSKTSDGSGAGSFTSAITGLIANTYYYVRSYATNTDGTSYGDEVVFETLPTTPTVSTTAISSITVRSAVSGGNVTLQGGRDVTAKGVCWSTSASPSIADSKTNDGIGLGSYTSSITGLTVNTTYYVRAYATNIEGTSYGSQVSFITTAITVPVTSVTVTGTGGATSITVDDGTLQMIATVIPNNATDKSVVWSVVNGTGTASISSTGLLKALTDGTVTVVATPNG